MMILMDNKISSNEENEKKSRHVGLNKAHKQNENDRIKLKGKPPEETSHNF